MRIALIAVALAVAGCAEGMPTYTPQQRAAIMAPMAYPQPDYFPQMPYQQQPARRIVNCTTYGNNTQCY